MVDLYSASWGYIEIDKIIFAYFDIKYPKVIIILYKIPPEDGPTTQEL